MNGHVGAGAEGFEGVYGGKGFGIGMLKDRRWNLQMQWDWLTVIHDS